MTLKEVIPSALEATSPQEAAGGPSKDQDCPLDVPDSP